MTMPKQVYPDTVITRDNFDRCYRLARQMYIITDAHINASESGYLQRMLDDKFKELDEQLYKFSRGQYWAFRDMVWNKYHPLDRYKNQRWLEVVLQRTDFRARERYGKITEWLVKLQGGDIPF